VCGGFGSVSITMRVVEERVSSRNAACGTFLSVGWGRLFGGVVCAKMPAFRVCRRMDSESKKESVDGCVARDSFSTMCVTHEITGLFVWGGF
jgi:hypothetical protein